MHDEEQELGVPFPGRILPHEQWTQTALRRLPTRGPFDWRSVFGRDAPVILDLGCGNGRSVLVSAVARPHCDHLGVDVLPLVIRYAVRRANRRGLCNVRFAVADAREVMCRLVPMRSVSEVHVYHPQPFHDLADAHRRLITPDFLARVHRALVPGGRLFLQSDNLGYWQYLRAVVPLFFAFEEHNGPWPDAPQGKTRREILALQRGLTVYRGIGLARSGLDENLARQHAERLPPPLFSADADLCELDALEEDG